MLSMKDEMTPRMKDLIVRAIVLTRVICTGQLMPLEEAQKLADAAIDLADDIDEEQNKV